MTDSSNSAVLTVSADDTLNFTDVETGISDGEYIEIISGLKENEIVVTSDEAGLLEGMKVDITLEEGEDFGGKQ